MMFCPLFYRLPTLPKALDMVRHNISQSNNIMRYLYNRGEVYFHESLVILQMAQ